MINTLWPQKYEQLFKLSYFEGKKVVLFAKQPNPITPKNRNCKLNNFLTS